MARISKLINSQPIRCNKSELIIKQGTCLIQHRKHKSNTQRIEIKQVSFRSPIFYLKYTCMDEDCKARVRSMYISLNDEWKYPWLLEPLQGIHRLPIRAYKVIHAFFCTLLSNGVLSCRKPSIANSIIKPNTIRTNHSDYFFTSYLYDNIIHTGCCQSSAHCLQFHYKKSSHTKYNKNKVCEIYCSICKDWINYDTWIIDIKM